MNWYKMKWVRKMEYIMIVLRTSFFYFFIIAVYRMMGKREVGQLGIVDLIVSILIAELVALSIGNAEISILVSLLPISILMIFQIVLAHLSLKQPKFRDVLEGKPSVIIHNGKINFKEMVEQRYNLDDLLTQLREAGICSLEEVAHAILESSGKLSVFKKEGEAAYPMPLIVDGAIQKDTLKAINKNETWLNKMLETKKVTLENVFYAFYKEDKTYIIKKTELAS